MYNIYLSNKYMLYIHIGSHLIKNVLPCSSNCFSIIELVNNKVVY